MTNKMPKIDQKYKHIESGDINEVKGWDKFNDTVYFKEFHPSGIPCVADLHNFFEQFEELPFSPKQEPIIEAARETNFVRNEKDQMELACSKEYKTGIADCHYFLSFISVNRDNEENAQDLQDLADSMLENFLGKNAINRLSETRNGDVEKPRAESIWKPVSELPWRKYSNSVGEIVIIKLKDSKKGEWAPWFGFHNESAFQDLDGEFDFDDIDIIHISLADLVDQVELLTEAINTEQKARIELEERVKKLEVR